MPDYDAALLLRLIDEVLVELGTSSLVDGRKARDTMLDIRNIIAAFERKVEDVVPTL